MKNKCTGRGNCNITPCLCRRPLGFCIKESGIDFHRRCLKILLFVLNFCGYLLTDPAVGVIDSEVVRVYSQRFCHSVGFYGDLLGCGAEL